MHLHLRNRQLFAGASADMTSMREFLGEVPICDFSAVDVKSGSRTLLPAKGHTDKQTDDKDVPVQGTQTYNTG